MSTSQTAKALVAVILTGLLFPAISMAEEAEVAVIEVAEPVEIVEEVIVTKAECEVMVTEGVEEASTTVEETVVVVEETAEMVEEAVATETDEAAEVVVEETEEVEE